jgi:hypothetical protein
LPGRSGQASTLQFYRIAELTEASLN